MLRNRLLILMFVLLAGVLGGCSMASDPVPVGPVQTGSTAGDAAPAPEVDREANVMNGELIYYDKCTACHGPSGDGDGEMAEVITGEGIAIPNFTDAEYVRTRSPQDYFTTITEGRLDRIMPAFDTLSDAEKWDVAYFLYTFATPADDILLGKEIYDSAFSETYGAEGEEIGLNDRGTAAAYTLQAIIDEFLADADLSEDEQWAVAAYMQTFSYLSMVDAAPHAGSDTAEDTGEDADGEDNTEDDTETAAMNYVRGVVTNFTPDGGSPAGLELQLTGLTLDETGQVVEFISLTGTVDDDGTFEFTDLDFTVDPGAYVVEVLYDGVLYGQGGIIDTAMPFLDIEVPIFEKTTDENVVTVSSMHMLMQQHQDTLLVQQYYIFNNSSDYVFVTEDPVSGGKLGSIAVSLPPDAFNIAFEEGELGGRFVPFEDKIYDTEHLYPGEHSSVVQVSYMLPIDGSKQIEAPILYQTDTLTVMLQDGLRLRSSDVIEQGESDAMGGTFNQYQGENFAAGSAVTLRVMPPSKILGLLPVIFVAAAGVLLGVVAMMWFIKRRETMIDLSEAGLSVKVEGVVRQIADLDAAFEDGRISRFDYETQRAELKASLVEEMET